MRRLRILTWHVHGSYLHYLTHAPHDFFLPVKPGRPEGYGGRLGGFPWGDNVYDVAADNVCNTAFDCIVFQSAKNYEHDQHEILTPAQRELPRVYLEHDPPRESPTNTRHPVDDPAVLLVHVTAFNNLMWDNGRTPTMVIEHGVTVPKEARYTGELAKGIVVVNGLHKRGRRLGHDLFEQVRQDIPLDLVGMLSEQIGGLGEIAHAELAAFTARYRFFFNPIRYTSLGLAVCEAMMVGLPIVALATTEMATVVENNVTGFIDTDVTRLAVAMQALIDDPALAQHLSTNAALYARERFGIERFVDDWNHVLRTITA